jgi:hypothetical protein
MKTIFDHIEYVRGKPHHVRKRVAFATAAGITAVIALVWFIGSLSLGAFAISGSSFADSTGQSPAVTTDNNTGDTGIAGAAAALPSATTPAHIEIIDAASSTSGQSKAEQTIIPF